jgi:lysozyme family protein
MIDSKSSIWKKYMAHVALWEGKLSKSPKDVTAARCVLPGQYHTNRGVTFCTFKNYAQRLNVTPVTYDRFIKMTDEEAGRFLYYFYANGLISQLPDSIAFSVTEAKWLSGNHSVKHLQDILGFPKTGILTPEIIRAANNANEAELFEKYWSYRTKWLINLAESPGKDKNYPNRWARKGWVNRQNAFKKFAPNKGLFKNIFSLFL